MQQQRLRETISHLYPADRWVHGKKERKAELQKTSFLFVIHSNKINSNKKREKAFERENYKYFNSKSIWKTKAKENISNIVIKIAQPSFKTKQEKISFQIVSTRIPTNS